MLAQLQLSWRRTLPIIYQGEAAECGLACLAMVSGYYSRPRRLAELRMEFPLSARGVSLVELTQVAAALQLRARGVKLELEGLPELRLPAILHWRFSHFVVLERVSANQQQYVIHDPAAGRRVVTRQEMSECFTGVALEVVPADDFQPRPAAPGLTLRGLLGRIRGGWAAGAQLLLAALLLELVGLSLPLASQLVVDQALPNHDESLLTLIGLGFVLLALLQSVLGFTRNWALAVLSLTLRAQVAERLFRHVLRLPLAFFERRHALDLVSRFDSLQALERTLSQTLLQSVLDGVLGLGLLLVLFAYAGKLGLLALLGLGTYAGLRAVLQRPMREAQFAAIEMGVRRQVTLTETLQSMLSIRLAVREPWRLAAWNADYSTEVNAQLRNEFWRSLARSLLMVTLGLLSILMLWQGARLVLEQALTLGGLLAIMAYQAQLSQRAASCIESLYEFRLLRVHLDRVADLVQTAPEPIPATGGEPPTTPLTLELRDVSFRYSPSDPLILDRVSLTIAAGSHVAITGPSGSGKTTLLKILMGVLEPSSGEVLVNGQPLTQFGVTRYRQAMSAVQQDERLFFGSIADNVSFFADAAAPERLVAALTLAGLAAEVQQLPMQTQALVAEGGSNFSGGQRQRLALARALYRQPQVLLLDEATSHLDAASEEQVLRNLAALPLTRVSVAHRVETIRAAQRVLVLQAGRVVLDQAQPGLTGTPPAPEATPPAAA